MKRFAIVAIFLSLLFVGNAHAENQSGTDIKIEQLQKQIDELKADTKKSLDERVEEKDIEVLKDRVGDINGSIDRFGYLLGALGLLLTMLLVVFGVVTYRNAKNDAKKEAEDATKEWIENEGKVQLEPIVRKLEEEAQTKIKEVVETSKINSKKELGNIVKKLEEDFKQLAEEKTNKFNKLFTSLKIQYEKQIEISKQKLIQLEKRYTSKEKENIEKEAKISEKREIKTFDDYWNIILQHYTKNEFTKILSVIEEVEKLDNLSDKQDFDLLYAKALAYKNLNEHKKATECYEKIKKYYIKDKSIEQNLAKDSINNYYEHTVALARAVTISENYESDDYLTHIYKRLKENEKVKEYYKKEKETNYLPIGYQLNQYIIEQYLKFGGSGIIYLAKDNNLNKKIIIKEYYPSDIAYRDIVMKTVRPYNTHTKVYEERLEAFLNEVKTLAKFDTNPNIVHIIEHFRANGTAYFVMPFEDGEDLAQYLSKHGKMSEKEILDIILPLLKTLQEIHKIGMIHRDIKPANIFMRANKTPLLIDFGTARYAFGKNSKSLTSILTAGYAPIEQYDSTSVQGAYTDIYALGATIYMMATYSVPPESTSRSLAKLKNLADPLKPLNNSKYSLGFRNAVSKALNIIAEDRYQNIEEFDKELRVLI